MSFSALTNEVRSSSQRSSREGATIDHIILHHSAATNAEVVLDMMTSGSRQVSSNYVIGNDGTIYGVVDEEDRAWTSGSSDDGGKGAAWDRRSITFECLDLSTDGWTISDASYKSIAAVMADVAKRYGFELVRAGANSSVFGHKDLWDYFQASYPTACPGGMDVDHVTALANTTNGTIQEDEMSAADVESIKSIVRRESRARLYQNTATKLYMIAKIDTGYCRVLAGATQAEQESEIDSLKQNGYLEIASEEVAQPVDQTRWDNVIAKCAAARKAIADAK